jgi:hypothetical protein
MEKTAEDYEYLMFDPEQQTAEAAASRKKLSPRPPGSSYVADLNGYRVTQDMLRHPAGQHWSEIIGVGAIVRTSYGLDRPYLVEKIHEGTKYGVQYISLICSAEDTRRRKDGQLKNDTDFSYLNEYVAVDGKLLALFISNNDEVIVGGEFKPKKQMQIRMF